ncbi:MAG: MFS transporter [Candidatus Methylacidiphilales bacterium]
MKGWFGFLWEFRRALGFGLLAAFLSSFGQTYFVSLFLEPVSARAGISVGDFGTGYAAATLVSGLLLVRLGRWLDQAGEAATFVPLGLVLATGIGLMAWCPHPAVLFLAFFIIRFAGQGGMGLVSTSAMARYFVRRRGMALSLASLGFPLGEVCLPGLVLVGTSVVGWQGVLAVVALALVVMVSGPGRWLTARPLRGDAPLHEPEGQSAGQGDAFCWFKDPFFLGVTLITGLTGPFLGTIMFLYQLPIAAERGIEPGWVATSFSVFALVRAGMSLGIGPAIDRWGGRRLFPWGFVPIGVAIWWYALIPGPMGLVGFYVGVGVFFGSGSIITAMLAEVYGARQIGEVRGAGNAAGVISSALGPFVAGWLLNQGVSYADIVLGLAWMTVGAVVAAFTLWRVGLREAVAMTRDG